MTKTKIEIIKLKPSEDMALTNGNVISYSEVYLGVNDSEENWYEIPLDEAKKLEEEKLSKEEKNEIDS